MCFELSFYIAAVLCPQDKQLNISGNNTLRVALQHIPHFTSKSSLPLAGLCRADKIISKNIQNKNYFKKYSKKVSLEMRSRKTTKLHKEGHGVKFNNTHLHPHPNT